jgi:L-asparagine transporter-like permease
MWVDIYKFIHISCMLTLCGLILVNTVLSMQKDQKLASSIKLDLFCFITIACLYFTGAMLVIPKGFTFITPWINAAFAFVSVISIQIGLGIYLKTFYFNKVKWLISLNYSVMLIILIAIIHDAVTKHTLWQ